MLTDWHSGATRFFRALRRSLWILLLSPAVAALIAGTVSIRQVPQYQAQSMVLVRPAQTPTDQLTQTYANMLMQRPLLEQVVRQLHLSEQPEALSRQLIVNIAPGTTILSVGATSPSPRLARDIANTLVNDFIAQVRQLEQQEGATRTTQTGDDLVVIAPATIPQHPVSPNPQRDVAVAAGTGLLIGLIIAGAREYLDQTIRSDEELLQRVGMPPIGHIPYVPAGPDARGELPALQPAAPVAESYRALRTNLMFSKDCGLIKTVLIASPVGGEGKSRTAANLAISLARAGHSTVLLDANFHRPSLTGFFGLRSSTTLSRLISQTGERRDPAIVVDGLCDLHLISAGSPPANPSEMLGSAEMRELLADLRNQFDYVIIDTPSVNLAADACALAATAEACVLVVESGRTTYHETLYAKRALEQVGARIAGIVVNKLGRNAFAYYSYWHRIDRRRQLRGGRSRSLSSASAVSEEGRPASRPQEGGPA